MSNVHSRVALLEKRCPRVLGLHLYAAFVDGEGLVLDERSPEARPWVGRHYSELPGPVSFYAGVDPLAV